MPDVTPSDDDRCPRCGLNAAMDWHACPKAVELGTDDEKCRECRCCEDCTSACGWDI